ncbi:MAG: chromosome segregation protein SMC [Planctomycetota bacterium]|nr:MAG: chromosome segregation protein SMC [Planctomycetota bacterium]
MRLKRLESYGFKSFADRMTFDFESGITAIIGPNGCGKSNVVDSIKWVVGEQSAKALRGAEMADIIFNGCSTRRPMALCEVTLVLDQVGAEKGLGGGEVGITRRLTRDGQSSYYLNGKACRLRDIRELLMDTGVGTSAYSVIEQGRIGFILEASTKDRRALLEEAAGISRYKARRKVAMRKLERVQVDLERISQLLGEIERRLRSVSRQAATALKYQELSAILRDLRLVFALEEFGRLSNERSGLGERAEKLQGEALALSARIAELEAATSGADAELLELENQLREVEGQRAAAMSSRDVSASRLRDTKARLVEIDQREEEDRKALAGHNERLSAMAAEIAATEHTLSQSMEEGDSGLTRIYNERRAEIDALINAIDGVLSGVEERKNRHVECLREVSRIEAEQSRIEAGRRQLLERRQRLAERRSQHDEQTQEVQQRGEACLNQLDSAQAAADAAHAKLDELIRSREEAQAQGNQLDNKLNELRHEENRADVRLRLLNEYERKAEGVQRGPRSVLQQMDRLPGVVGLVADCFTVDKDHELAIETALGGAAQHIITETQVAAKEAIDYLKRERRGRATFLPLDDVRGRERPPHRYLNAPGVIGLASDLVHFDKRMRPVFEYLLGGILVVDSLDHAIALRRDGARSLLVTLDGEVINPGGAMTGGRSQGQEAGGLVSRKNEINRLEQQLQELTAQRAQMGLERDEAKKAAFAASLAVEEQRKVIHQAERSLGETKAELMKAERDRLHIEEFATSFANELDEIDSELQRMGADEVDLRGQRDWFQALAGRLDHELIARQQQLAELSGRRDTLQEEISGLRVDLATTEERREALRNHISHLRRSMQDLEDQRAERERRLSNHDQQRAELGTIVRESEALHTQMAAEVETLSQRFNELINKRDSNRNQLEHERQELRSLSARHRNLEREHSETELKLGELRVRLESLSERILEDYEVDLAEAFANWQRPDDLDLPAVRRELAETERQLSALGPVNLAAIDELKEVQVRRDFLAQQHEDLAGAATKLAEIIEQINNTSRKLFTATYKQVRRNFQELFRKLFGGGKADLILEQNEGEDILEAGLDIIAQPPGKQPKSITLLSGGEKALTAIALLFGVYQIKPSPFCILDEVDAPLDDSNTDVYCRMIEDFCSESQFIVITHNKRTMQFADAIYGITQSEPGVSKKISVKLENIEHQAADLLSMGPARGSGPFAG